MKSVAICSLLIGTMGLAPALLAEEAPWKAAAGALAITPSEPVWMAGYAARDEPSTGKVHDLFAKVLVIEDAANARLVIVTTDLLGITMELRAGVEDFIKPHGIAAQSLLMNASHTHCGPELRDDRILRYGIDAKYAALARQYVRDTAKRIGQLIVDTAAEVQPARLIYSHARAGFAMNRRLPTDRGVINSPNPDGPVDHEVPVLQVQDLGGNLRAVLFGYACHATTLSFQQLCGDYPGFAQQYIEQSHPAVVAMFVNGCSADQNPYPRRSLALAQQHGRALANGVETALQTLNRREIKGPLRVVLDRVSLRFADPPPRSELEALASSGNRYDRIHAATLLEQLDDDGEIQTEFDRFPIQVVQLGDSFTLVAICGEVVVDYSLRLKKELVTDDNSIVWVAGYSNHVFGYLPSARVLSEGGYEAGGAMRYTTFPGPFDASVEDRVIRKINELVARVRTTGVPAD